MTLKLRMKIKDVVLIAEEGDCNANLLAQKIQSYQEPDGEIQLVIDPFSEPKYDTGFRGWTTAQIKLRSLGAEVSKS